MAAQRKIGVPSVGDLVEQLMVVGSEQDAIGRGSPGKSRDEFRATSPSY
jgi:hypothetical protein